MAIFVTVLGGNLFGSDDKNIIKKQFARIHDIVVIPIFGQTGIPFFIYDNKSTTKAVDNLFIAANPLPSHIHTEERSSPLFSQ